MKRKLTVSLIAVMLVLSSFGVGAFAAVKYFLFINGKMVKADVKVINGTPYIPLSVLSSYLKETSIKYDAKKGTITIDEPKPKAQPEQSEPTQKQPDNVTTNNTSQLTEKYQRLPVRRLAVKIGGKVYMSEDVITGGLYADGNNNIYADSNGLNVFIILLNVRYSKYILYTIDNPFVDGAIKLDNDKHQFVEAEGKYATATEMYFEGSIVNFDKTIKIPFRAKKGDSLGLIELNGYRFLISITDVFDKFDIPLKYEIDKTNQIVIFSVE